MYLVKECFPSTWADYKARTENVCNLDEMLEIDFIKEKTSSDLYISVEKGYRIIEIWTINKKGWNLHIGNIYIDENIPSDFCFENSKKVYLIRDGKKIRRG